MNRVRAAFLDASAVAIDLLATPEVEAKWDEPSALAEWSVRGLAGHLVRATTSVEMYLDADPDPAGEPISVGATTRARSSRTIYTRTSIERSGLAARRWLRTAWSR